MIILIIYTHTKVLEYDRVFANFCQPIIIIIVVLFRGQTVNTFIHSYYILLL